MGFGSLFEKSAAKAAAKAAEKSAAKAAAIAAEKSAAKAAAIAAEKSAAKAAEAAALKAAAKAAEKDAAAVAAKAAEKAAASDVAKAAEKSAASQVGRDTASTVASKAAAFVAAHPKLVVGGLAAAAVAAAATARFEKTDKKTLKITNIQMIDSRTAQITFTPALKLLKTDAIDIQGSDCNPSIDGTLQPLLSIVSDTVVTVATAVPITAPGTTGTLLTHSSFEGQLAGVISDATGAAGALAGKAANVLGLPSPAAIWAKFKYYIIALLILFAVGIMIKLI